MFKSPGEYFALCQPLCVTEQTERLVGSQGEALAVSVEVDRPQGGCRDIADASSLVSEDLAGLLGSAQNSVREILVQVWAEPSGSVFAGHGQESHL